MHIFLAIPLLYLIYIRLPHVLRIIMRSFSRCYRLPLHHLLLLLHLAAARIQWLLHLHAASDQTPSKWPGSADSTRELLLLVTVHLGLESLKELDLLLLILHGGLGQLRILLGLGFESELGKVRGEDSDGLGSFFGQSPCLCGQ